ncbi:MAG: hypothetical protein EA399_11900 [Desulfovibrionales bacterium]|nr:MAG: hypothetical protein EA399_11900 [Desulfovibrionales bacterium]
MFRTAARNQFFLIRFVKDVPTWEHFDGHALHPAEPPGSSRSLPILALVPDRLFFFYQPESDHHFGSFRQRSAAARLELEQIFPGRKPEYAPSIVHNTAGTHMLGCFSHPELTEFFQRHQAVLAQANAVTTASFLAWSASHQRHHSNWLWSNPEDGITAAMFDGRMTYFPGKATELSARRSSADSGVDAREKPTDAVREWRLPELLQAAPEIGWSQLRLPLPAATTGASTTRRLVRWWAAMVLLGALICSGQFFRLSTHQAQAEHWERATSRHYAEVLTPPLGADPFGRLLFRHSQLQRPIQSGPDALAILGLLSTSAPPEFHVENFSLGPNSGIIRARLASYEQLESLLNALEGHDRLRFDLDQATSTDDAILATLRVSY